MSTTSSPRGTFRLSGLAVGVAYQLRARKPGFAPLELEVGALEPAESRDRLEVVLRAGRLAAGRVVDESDAPVAGAEVTLRPPIPTDPLAVAYRMALQRGGEDGPTSTTDAEGRFEVGDLAVGRYDLEVRARGFAPARVPGLRVDEGVGQADFGTVVLVPGASIEGRVADPDGRPIAGAEVTVEIERDGLMALSLSGPRNRVETGADGRFVVADLVPDRPVTLAVAKPGYGSEFTSSVRPPVDAIAVVLRPSGGLKGRVVDAQGDPVAGARVMAAPDHRALASGPRRTPRRERPPWSRSDADGRFLIEDVEPGTLQVSVQAESYQRYVATGVEVEAGTEREIEIVLETGATVEGRITTADGVPLAQASVQVAPRRDTRFGGNRFGGSSSGRTDAEGRYRVDGAGLGPASITVFHGDRQRLTEAIEVRPGGNVVDLVLDSGFEVSGQVVSADGEPIGGAALSLQPGDLQRISFDASPPAVSGTDGTFVLADVAAGSYRLKASREGFAAATSEIFEVADDVTGLLLELGRGATLQGRVLGLEPDELGSLELVAFSATSGMRRGEFDFEARYAFANLAPGPWHVRAQVGSSGRMTARQVEIPEGVTEVSEDIEFVSGFTLARRRPRRRRAAGRRPGRRRRPDGQHGAGVDRRRGPVPHRPPQGRQLPGDGDVRSPGPAQRIARARRRPRAADRDRDRRRLRGLARRRRRRVGGRRPRHPRVARRRRRCHPIPDVQRRHAGRERLAGHLRGARGCARGAGAWSPPSRDTPPARRRSSSPAAPPPRSRSG